MDFERGTPFPLDPPPGRPSRRIGHSQSNILATPVIDGASQTTSLSLQALTGREHIT